MASFIRASCRVASPRWRAELSGVGMPAGSFVRPSITSSCRKTDPVPAAPWGYAARPTLANQFGSNGWKILAGGRLGLAAYLTLAEGFPRDASARSDWPHRASLALCRAANAGPVVDPTVRSPP